MGSRHELPPTSWPAHLRRNGIRKRPPGRAISAIRGSCVQSRARGLDGSGGTRRSRASTKRRIATIGSSRALSPIAAPGGPRRPDPQGRGGRLRSAVTAEFPAPISMRRHGRSANWTRWWRCAGYRAGSIPVTGRTTTGAPGTRWTAGFRSARLSGKPPAPSPTPTSASTRRARRQAGGSNRAYPERLTQPWNGSCSRQIPV